MSELKELATQIEEFAKATVTAQEVADRALEKADALDMEQVTKASEAATKAMELAQELKAKIESVEKTGEYIEKLVSRMGSTGGGDEAKEMEAKAREETAFYLRTGVKMSAETTEAVIRATVGKSFVGVGPERAEAEIKTLIAGSNPDGGYFIRPERSATMIKRIFETSPMRSIANIETTSSDSIELVIDDDEGTSGGWVGESAARPATDTPQIGLLTIPAHEQYASPKATQKMLDDAGFDIEAWLGGKTTDKMTRTENTAFVNGDGSQKPRGFLQMPAWASAGVYERFKLEQVNSGAAANFKGDGVKKLKNALLEAYQANAKFVMQRASFEEIITLKDGNGAYLLDPRSFKSGDTQVLLGKEVVFFSDMPDVAADALAMAYGDFGIGYTILDRIGFRVIRDNVTDKPRIIFYTTKRTGGDVTNYESIKIQKLAV